ncbi:MAG: iron-containing redox enzyme family protein [Planctomycetota bacterium]
MQQLVTDILEQCGYRSNPYFAALRSGEMCHDDFVETQIQFYFAVVFFNRPMAALAAKIPTPELRVEVLRNVWEEHGEGDASRVHGRTFLEFLDRLAHVTEADVERRALWPEVRVFNTTLVGACVLDDYLIGAGLLGMIERMFCDISSWIGRAVVARGWLRAEQMIHYNLHQQLDVRHSQDFFDILARSWDHGPLNRYMIEQGLRLGATVFDGLYHGLYRNRARRAMREVTGPHSLVDFKP